MTLRQVLNLASAALNTAHIEDASLEAEVLLRNVLGIDRTQLILGLGGELAPADHERYQSLLNRRLEGEPLAYIIGHREFYGLDFIVDSRVLIPRPETELIVDTALNLCRENGFSDIADIGTGSGAIAVSLAVNLPWAKMTAVDISKDALTVALANCREHGVLDRVQLVAGDLIKPLTGQYDIIIANLPYVTTGEYREMDTYGWEPRIALDGGGDGLDLLKRLVVFVNEKIRPGGYLLLEIGQGQANAVRELFNDNHPAETVEILQDFAGIGRVVVVSFS